MRNLRKSKKSAKYMYTEQRGFSWFAAVKVEFLLKSAYEDYAADFCTPTCTYGSWFEAVRGTHSLTLYVALNQLSHFPSGKTLDIMTFKLQRAGTKKTQAQRNANAFALHNEIK